MTAEGFGVGEKTVEMKNIIDLDSNITVTVPYEDQVEPTEPLIEEKTTRDAVVPSAMTPKTVLRFLAPTLALWIAPPVMSLIDTSVVGRYCGPNRLGGSQCTSFLSTQA